MFNSKKNFYRIDKIVINCPKCRQRLRIPAFRHSVLKINCSTCKTEFSFNGKKYFAAQETLVRVKFISIIFFSAAVILMPIAGFISANISVKKIVCTSENNIIQEDNRFLKTIENIRKKYEEEISGININQLRETAQKTYQLEWEGRKHYDSRYAITPREKAQLEMLSLAQDKSLGIEDIVKRIAIKAAPKNSEINVYTDSRGIVLDINFDMATLTSGEEKTRTKHTSIESLKKEVIRLISRVTTDVYQFCQDLDLEAILIGCKHIVNYSDEYSSSEKDIVLYKVALYKKDIKDLKHNPFLDIYSATQYFKVQEDDFPNLRITAYAK